jgi:hypothetical protein
MDMNAIRAQAIHMKHGTADEEPPQSHGTAVSPVSVVTPSDQEQADAERARRVDAVDEQSEQSFPASDPPSFPASSI